MAVGVIVLRLAVEESSTITDPVWVQTMSMIALKTKADRTTRLPPVRLKIAVLINMESSNVPTESAFQNDGSVTEITIAETMTTKADLSVLTTFDQGTQSH